MTDEPKHILPADIARGLMRQFHAWRQAERAAWETERAQWAAAYDDMKAARDALLEERKDMIGEMQGLYDTIERAQNVLRNGAALAPEEVPTVDSVLAKGAKPAGFLARFLLNGDVPPVAKFTEEPRG